METDIFAPESLPPLVPEGEEVVSGELTFREMCLADIDGTVKTLRWKLGPELLTKSDRWGLTMRFDCVGPRGTIEGRVNRIVCWRAPNGTIVSQIAIGQKIPPLDAEE
jgi:hypothetical protein